MLIAFVLMGAILVVTPWAYRKLGITPPPPADQQQTAAGRKPEATGKAASSSNRGVHGQRSPDGSGDSASG